ncbi:l-amino-acid oxidase [Paramyrothecium foliicola]|nr:l-amino-acid oxidase [Paramyrothecium foliicola]
MVPSPAKLALWAGAALSTASSLPFHLETRSELTSHLANVHVSRQRSVDGAVSFTYGSCQAQSRDASHHTIGEYDKFLGSRIVWVIPRGTQSDGCISAWDEGGVLVGRSEPQKLHRVKRRALQKRSKCSIPMTNATGIDPIGPWFDGVELLSQKQPSPVHVEAAKSKEIAIVGAGMSSLMSYLVLSQAGFTNLSILEGGERLGGRLHTAYLSGGPFDYSYQEMGPMRLPMTYRDPVSNETLEIADHQLVIQLAEELSKLNKNDKNFSVDFIPWLQRNTNSFYYRNGFKLPTGLPPTVGQVSQNGSLGVIVTPDAVAEQLSELVDAQLPGSNFSVLMATNMYKAHKEWIENGLNGRGGDHWSEFAFMVNYLNGTLGSAALLRAHPSNSFWERIFEGFYFSASSWVTVDGGFSRLAQAFHPLVDQVTKMRRKIERVAYSKKSDKVTLQWRDSFKDTKFQEASYDYAIVGVPFSNVRKWRLPSLSPGITNAIQGIPYASACKVALEFSERFWEHYANPIYGGCNTVTDIPLVGNVCYPSYNINGTGPASIVASYVIYEAAQSITSMPEGEHVQYILDAMVEIHGESTRDLYTGNYNRRCWQEDPLQAGGFATPSIGQHETFIPEFFKTHSNMIFVGEHTAHTHAWISSALDSGIRGGVQLMLELGLVDEAKETVSKWMARWMDV